MSDSELGHNETRSPPCMRWRRPCLASPHQIVQLPGRSRATCRPPMPGTRMKGRFPCSSHVPELPPSGAVPDGESISTAFAKPAQEPALSHFQFFYYPHDIHRRRPVIRILPVIIHRVIHKQSTGFRGRGIPQAACPACNCLTTSSASFTCWPMLVIELKTSRTVPSRSIT